MLAAARRFVGTIAVIGGGAALVATAGALLVGGSVARAVSFALYIVGTMMIVVGFFAGVRGPLRSRSPTPTSSMGGVFGLDVYTRGVRSATGDERHDALVTTIFFLVIGMTLIAIGVAVDNRVSLV